MQQTIITLIPKKELNRKARELFPSFALNTKY